MNHRILSQNEMQHIRRAIDFCYICGSPLPARGEQSRRREVIGEHVVPRVLLSSEPNDQRDRWGVELDVHSCCEQANKQDIDHWLKMLQQMHNEAKEDWPKPGHIRNMPLVPGLVFDALSGSAFPGFSGLGDLFDGVWRWVSGLHVALYGQYLPSATWHLVLPPVPACCSDPSGPSLEDTETQSRLTRKTIERAVAMDKWDGITAWGGALQYRCVWWQLHRPNTDPKWVCFWTLSFPGLEEWSRLVLPAGEDRPWHGSYVLDDHPADASCLVSDDFPDAEQSSDLG